MSALRTLLGKELHATFTSPVGYAIATVFLLVLGYTFALTLFATHVANLNYIFHQMYVLSILLVPSLTMRAFAEERRNDTLELLLTAPVRETSIVLAKFLAAYLLVLMIYALSGVNALVLGLYGEPDWGPITSGYLALALLAAMLVAIGIWISGLTENQVVAASATLGVFLMLWFADSAAVMLPSPLDSLVINASLIGHFKPLVTGSVFVSDAGYFVSGAMLALFLAARRLASRA
jgi:ABC-2 type transport system permease protein